MRPEVPEPKMRYENGKTPAKPSAPLSFSYLTKSVFMPTWRRRRAGDRAPRIAGGFGVVDQREAAMQMAGRSMGRPKPSRGRRCGDQPGRIICTTMLRNSSAATGLWSRAKPPALTSTNRSGAVSPVMTVAGTGRSSRPCTARIASNPVSPPRRR